MKFNDYEIAQKKDKFTEVGVTYKEVINNIFQWVKDGKINPRQMEELMKFCYEYFNKDVDISPQSFEDVLYTFNKQHTFVDFKLTPSKGVYESTPQGLKNSTAALFSSNNVKIINLSEY